MAIANIQTINVGLPNESVGSDSLYDAFTKAKTNFNILASCASPYNTFIGANGIQTNANSSTGVLTITNTGVTQLIAGTGVSLSANSGIVEISATGNSNGNSGVTSVGLVPINNTRLVVTNSPVVSAGNINIDLATSGVSAATYTNPTLTIDSYGRVTNASNNTVSGTVTSVGITPGSGISVAGGIITSNGNITVTNTGVLSLTAGTGISLSGSNGAVTVSTAPISAVTSIGVSSNSLSITNSPVTSVGVINLESPIGFSSENLANGAAVSLTNTASYFSTTGASTATLAAGTAGQIKTLMMVTHGGDMVITVSNAGWKSSGTGTATFSAVGQGCTLQYINSNWFCVGNNGVTFG